MSRLHFHQQMLSFLVVSGVANVVKPKNRRPKTFPDLLFDLRNMQD